MKTRCPGCNSRYDIDPTLLLEADGLGRCYRCNTVFDMTAHAVESERSAEADARKRAPLLDASDELVEPVAPDHRDAPNDLPFQVPEDLSPLQASPDAALDVADTLYERRSYRGLIYGWLVVLLLIALGLQLAWQFRDRLLAEYPQLGFVCEHLPCEPHIIDQPENLLVLNRSIKATENAPGALTLKATVLNDASASQRLPDIQLSLFDNNGTVLIRRRLIPREYSFPPPSPDRLVKPGEVFTISVDFKDPGEQATGFRIDFM